MSDYQKVKYNKNVFYVDLENPPRVYDSQFQVVTLKKATTMDFRSLDEFYSLLIKLIEKPKTEYYTELQFKELLAENLLLDTFKLSPIYMTDLLKNVNYATIKKSDTNKILETLEKILSKNKNLSYNYLSLDLGQKVTDKTIKSHKFFKEPFGKLENTLVYGIPFLFPKQMQILTKSLNF